MKIRTRIAFLMGAAALATGGLYTGIAQSQQAPLPDQSRQLAAERMVHDAYKAGKGRVHAVAKQYAGIWRNGQYHFVEYVQKVILVDTPYGPAEINEISGRHDVESQLPPINPGLSNRAPTAAETAAMDAKLNAMNNEGKRAAGLPPVPEHLLRN